MNFSEKDLKDIQVAAKERTVRTQTVEYGLDTLIKRIDDKVIKLDPDYQRHHRWDDATSSRLIESMMLNIPIPYIYISKDIDVDDETEDTARYTVIDGQQRLTAIYNFLKGMYALKGLRVLPKMESVKYEELPNFLKRRLDERTVKCLIIDSTFDRKVKYEIFERLNTGSLELSNQEVRNAIYRGPFNDMIKNIAKNDVVKKLFYLKVQKGEIYASKQKAMDDIELILRFFAFSIDEGYKTYQGDLKEFLNEKMELFNKCTKQEIHSMEKSFYETMKEIDERLGENWFSKYKKDGTFLKITSKFNVSVYDAIAAAVYLEKQYDSLTRENLNKVFRESGFASSVEGSTMDVKKVTTRINRIRKLLKDGK